MARDKVWRYGEWGNSIKLCEIPQEYKIITETLLDPLLPGIYCFYFIVTETDTCCLQTGAPDTMVFDHVISSTSRFHNPDIGITLPALQTYYSQLLPCFICLILFSQCMFVGDSFALLKHAPSIIVYGFLYISPRFVWMLSRYRTPESVWMSSKRREEDDL